MISFDADYGPYLGHPADPRTPESDTVECSGPTCLAALEPEDAHWLDGEPYCDHCAWEFA